jgi:PQQ-like domain
MKTAIFQPAIATFFLMTAFANGACAWQDNESADNRGGDWPMLGGTIHRNLVSQAKGINYEFDLKSGNNVAWTAKLGSQTYASPVVAGGKVLVGANNGGGYRADKHPAEDDRGVLLCFDEKSGEFLWQLTREKLEIGKACDWPLQGICSIPAVEAGGPLGTEWRAWVVTNRAELMCLDLEGMRNGNGGAVTDEVDATEKDADILWSLDMIKELGVFPHHLATSSPVIVGDRVFVFTSNGVDESNTKVHSPEAPSMLCVDKNTGEVLWQKNYPGDGILDGQWSSPTVGEVNGQTQVYFPGGDGWLYALNAVDGEIIWKFDLNPKETVYKLGGTGERSYVVATAVFIDNTVLVATGQDPEDGEGVGNLWRIDATKTGDVSAELGEIGKPGTANPNSAAIWHYGGGDPDGSLTKKKGRSIFRRTLSTVAVSGQLVYAVDLAGFVHCVDFKTGKRHWEHDLFAGVWGSPLAVDGHVFLGQEDGKLICFEDNKDEFVLSHEYDTVNYSAIYSTPVIANGRLYLTDRTTLYAVDLFPSGD